MGMSVSVARLNLGLFEANEEETVDRFCRTCIFFHETRARLLPGEAPDLVPPACYFRANAMPPGWCLGNAYEEDIP